LVGIEGYAFHKFHVHYLTLLVAFLKQSFIQSGAAADTFPFRAADGVLAPAAHGQAGCSGYTTEA
jgi:uncharacterized protein YjlB